MDKLETTTTTTTTTTTEEDFLALDPEPTNSGDYGDGDGDGENEDYISLMPINGDNDDDDRNGNEDEDPRAAEGQTTSDSNADTTTTTTTREKEAESNQRRRDDFFHNHGLPPWMENYVDHRRVNPLVALHNEIVAFCRLMEPRREEMKTREDLLEKFSNLAKSTFRKCKVEVFGSQATGLCLPSSDIDIVIQLEEQEETAEKGKTEKKKKKKEKVSKQQELEDMENWDKPTGSPLRLLAGALREQWLDDLSYLEVIENTRIPLVKLTHAPTNISIDVCFNQAGGPQAAALMNQYMDALSPLRPLTFFLKKFMASRGLNQPYTGGVGSFLLQMMILAFLQQRERHCFNQQRPSQHCLGALLVEFFEFYSTDYNFVLVGISVRFDGFFFPKGAADRKKNFWQTNRPFSIAVENPLDPTFDVGSPSFRIDLVQRSFEVAFRDLLCHVSEPMVPTTSILASILEPSEEMWERQRQIMPTFTPRAGQAASNHNNNNNNNNNNSMPPRKRQRRR